DRHAVRRAAHVVQASAVAELDARRLAAVLTTDTNLEVGASAAATLGTELDQLANTVLIQHLEGVVLQQLALDVARQEAPGVVAAQAKGGLGQVVGAEREELSFLRD